MDTLTTLAETIAERATVAPDRSWTAALLQKGRPTIARKIGEEAVETVVASLSEDKQAVINESADLLYHLSVLWYDMDISPADIRGELQRREGQSGIQEKLSRKI